MASKAKSGSNVTSGPGSKSGAKMEGSVGAGGGDAGAEATERSHDVAFAKGGNTAMFGEQAAGDQKPGGTAHNVSGGAPGAKYAEGGKTPMFGYAGAQPAEAGKTSAR